MYVMISWLPDNFEHGSVDFVYAYNNKILNSLKKPASGKTVVMKFLKSIIIDMVGKKAFSPETEWP